MNRARRVLAVAAATASAVVGLAAPSSADHQCAGEPLCFVTDELVIPVGTPVGVSPTTVGGYAVPGPRLCDTTTGNCTDTYVLLPRVYVSTEARTLTTVTVPAFGVAYDPKGVPIVYYGVPPLPSLDGTLLDEAELSVAVPVRPVGTTGGGTPVCPSTAPSDGVVRVSLTRSCWLVVYLGV